MSHHTLHLTLFALPPPSSYNPAHAGHLSLLHYLSLRHTTVYAIVGFNPSKSYPVSPSSRVLLLQRQLEGMGIKNVKPVMVKGLIWKWAKSKGVDVMYRGIRTWKQDGGAERHLLFQNTFYPYLLGLCLPVPTKFLECKPSLRGVSSTRVRAAIRGGDDRELESLVGGEWKEVKKAYEGNL
ncbi:hypothetical protein TrCOL_g916 [Triparma columacea]|uniref:Cytidyltransferase-like domain-containing protein n=1 Tax=Triparma columacea TaxID=722753 RepID=A0A9W7GM66_9STRA|nr:hypothetical protein TrCOL_g916 [Triparma columacea]